MERNRKSETSELVSRCSSVRRDEGKEEDRPSGFDSSVVSAKSKWLVREGKRRLWGV